MLGMILNFETSGDPPHIQRVLRQCNISLHIQTHLRVWLGAATFVAFATPLPLAFCVVCLLLLLDFSMHLYLFASFLLEFQLSSFASLQNIFSFLNTHTSTLAESYIRAHSCFCCCY